MRGCKESPEIKAVSFGNEAHRLSMHIFITVGVLAKVLLCVVALDCGSLSQIGNGTALDGLACAVSANGVAQYAGGPDGAVAVLKTGAGSLSFEFTPGQPLHCLIEMPSRMLSTVSMESSMPSLLLTSSMKYHYNACEGTVNAKITAPAFAAVPIKRTKHIHCFAGGCVFDPLAVISTETTPIKGMMNC